MVISVAVGTSMLQFKNILKKPIIWLPPIIVLAILGSVATTIFELEWELVALSKTVI
ncbi:PTS sugar transporter subunit IIC [Campylobacter iguaniorum]|uniref:PTS sugar transporter subunit IIC n=1 Tax=Campylobacter iguaniorum TaxID=1244531 RepID=UPI0009EED790|nr:PTS sugar transporter subunit IIC [Campylobacter iguaniorum]